MANGDLSAEERRKIRTLLYRFYNTAIFQGHIVTDLMVFYAFYYELFKSYFNFNPDLFLYRNMCYGNFFYIFSRKSMRKIRFLYRLTFSFFGAWMFSYSLRNSIFYISNINRNPAWWKVLIGMIGVRILGSIFYSYLYFVDSCTATNRRRREDTVFIYS